MCDITPLLPGGELYSVEANSTIGGFRNTFKYIVILILSEDSSGRRERAETTIHDIFYGKRFRDSEMSIWFSSLPTEVPMDIEGDDEGSETIDSRKGDFSLLSQTSGNTKQQPQSKVVLCL